MYDTVSTLPISQSFPVPSSHSWSQESRTQRVWTLKGAGWNGGACRVDKTASHWAIRQSTQLWYSMGHGYSPRAPSFSATVRMYLLKFFVRLRPVKYDSVKLFRDDGGTWLMVSHSWKFCRSYQAPNNATTAEIRNSICHVVLWDRA